MKILITTDLYTVTSNGVVTSVKNLFDELKARGHDVRILTLSENSRSHRDQSVYFIQSKPFYVYPNIRKPLSYVNLPLVTELIEWKPDIIHSQCEFFTMQFAIRISRKTGAPIVHTYHTMYEEYSGYLIPWKRLGKWVARTFTMKRLDHASLVIVPTPKIAELLREYELNIPLRIIPTGISLDQHKQRISPEFRLAKRRELGIRDDQTVLLNLGRLGLEKNIDELLRYFSQMLKKRPDLVFLIVGDGPARDRLDALVKKLDLSEHVIFTGSVQYYEVHEYYQLGDLFVCASTSETQGLTFIEAAANGLPLLCRKDPCLDPIIQQGVNGFQYETPDEFYSFSEQILSDAEWRARAGKESEKIAAVFDKHSFGEAAEAAYSFVLENSKADFSAPDELPSGKGSG
ncbi:MAG: glycosyltransferase family 4 protein [Eubacteriales bacterium]|nr:glycosyltransferase family 4 protein [Eubacteriales bacterium]